MAEAEAVGARAVDVGMVARVVDAGMVARVVDVGMVARAAVEGEDEVEVVDARAAGAVVAARAVVVAQDTTGYLVPPARLELLAGAVPLELLDRLVLLVRHGLERRSERTLIEWEAEL